MNLLSVVAAVITPGTSSSRSSKPVARPARWPWLVYPVMGMLFGLTLAKGEAISWFRIFEMFHFQSFHMYGIMGTAVLTGMWLVWLMHRLGLRDPYGNRLIYTPKQPGITRYLVGGTIFGLGWALTGACPGPLYVLVGHGMPVYLVVIAAALLGTLTYGWLRPRLPH